MNKPHYKLTSIEGRRPKETQRPSPEELETLRARLEKEGIPRKKPPVVIIRTAETPTVSRGTVNTKKLHQDTEDLLNGILTTNHQPSRISHTMTPQEHYQEAEDLLETINDRMEELDGRRDRIDRINVELESIKTLALVAQAHATLATVKV